MGFISCAGYFEEEFILYSFIRFLSSFSNIKHNIQFLRLDSLDLTAALSYVLPYF